MSVGVLKSVQMALGGTQNKNIIIQFFINALSYLIFLILKHIIHVGPEYYISKHMRFEIVL